MKHLRFRWPNTIRNNVLARLVALNAEQAEDERLVGVAMTKPEKGRRRKGQTYLSDDKKVERSVLRENETRLRLWLELGHDRNRNGKTMNNGVWQMLRLGLCGSVGLFDVEHNGVPPYCTVNS